MGRPVYYGGEVTVFEPGKELAYQNDWIPNRWYEEPIFVTIRLSPAQGGTLVELFHNASDVAATNSAYGEGWGRTQLVALKVLIEDN